MVTEETAYAYIGTEKPKAGNGEILSCAVGKTLALDMLKTFFEKTKEDTSIYFKDKQIWACGEKYQKMQGAFPSLLLLLAFLPVSCVCQRRTCLVDLIIQS